MQLFDAEKQMSCFIIRKTDLEVGQKAPMLTTRQEPPQVPLQSLS
jgi:hypothetical protein